MENQSNDLKSLKLLGMSQSFFSQLEAFNFSPEEVVGVFSGCLSTSLAGLVATQRVSIGGIEKILSATKQQTLQLISDDACRAATGTMQ